MKRIALLLALTVSAPWTASHAADEGLFKRLIVIFEPCAPDRSVPLNNSDRNERDARDISGNTEIRPPGPDAPGKPVVSLPASDPAKPERPNDEWRMRHGERVADVRSHAGELEVIFIGDSITSGWRDTGKPIWEKEMDSLHAVNIGIAGSQTQHILWQFENGAIDGISPRVAVLMIGVNNVVAKPPNSAAEIARGITAIVAKLREKLPNTRVLLLGTFPKDRTPDSPDRRKIQEVNALIAKLDDGKTVQFADLTARFLEKDGTLAPNISPDGIHLSPAGYDIWAKALKELLPRPVK